MIRYRCLMWGVVAPVLLGVLPVAGQDAAAATKPVKPKPTSRKAPAVIRGEYKILSTVLKFTEEQNAALRSKLPVERAALADWDKKNAAKRKELQDALRKARDAKDADAGKKVSAELKSLEAERRAIQDGFRKEIMAILSPAQELAWRKFGAYRSMMRRYKRVGLAEAQGEAVRGLCDAAVAAIKDPKGERKAMDALAAKIEAEVLTDEQRAKLAAKSPRTRPRPATRRVPTKPVSSAPG